MYGEIARAGAASELTVRRTSAAPGLSGVMASADDADAASHKQTKERIWRSAAKLLYNERPLHEVVRGSDAGRAYLKDYAYLKGE